jgi:hemerythrin
MPDRHLFTWRPEYSVHIDAIDRQHQALVAMIRELQEAMEEGRI